jgi:hypothetical protein
MTTQKQIQKTENIIGDFVEYYKKAKGFPPKTVYVSKTQAQDLSVKEGDSYRGMTVKVI